MLYAQITTGVVSVFKSAKVPSVLTIDLYCYNQLRLKGYGEKHCESDGPLFLVNNVVRPTQHGSFWECLKIQMTMTYSSAN